MRRRGGESVCILKEAYLSIDSFLLDLAFMALASIYSSTFHAGEVYAANVVLNCFVQDVSTNSRN